MKKLLIIAAVAALSLPASAQMVRGEREFGPKLGYISHNKSALAGLVFRYATSSHLRISPEIGCAFRHHNQEALLIDLNLHFPFGVGGEKVALYPLAGLAFNSWSTHMVDAQDAVDVTTHFNRFGANLGAGFDLRCSSTLKLNIEAKYVLVKSYSSAVISAGISYVF